MRSPTGPYLEALTRLQDRVEPFAYEEVDRIVSGEIGVRISVLSRFRSQPLALAGPVHRACSATGRLWSKCSGRAFANRSSRISKHWVKLPIDAHTELGKRYDFEHAERVAQQLSTELDFKLEAGNLITFSENLREFEQIILS